jgi:hypothetical protein
LSGELLRQAFWITPNETETGELLKTNFNSNSDGGNGGFFAAANRFLDLGVHNALLKLGSRGCLIARTD